MLLGTKKSFLRHLLVGGISLAIFSFLWYALSASGMGLGSSWRALAITAFILLAFTLGIGPLAVLWKPSLKILAWRRETGIWFFLLALGHGFLSVWNMFSFDLSLVFHPSVALPNIMGSIALFFGFVLAATSSDRAVRFLGIGSWKWLHYFAYVIFYLVALHAMQYAFINPLSLMHWSRYLIIFFAVLVIVLQFSAFFKIVSGQRKRSQPKKTRRVKAKILQRKEIAKGTFEVKFSVKNYPFTAGQHTGVRLPKLFHNDPKGKFRVFSIVEPPGSNEVRVAFRNTESGFKKTLLELPLKTNVELDPASGYFTLPKEKTDVCFIAGGIGITPFMSMVRYAAEKNLPHKITLHYSNRNKESAAYLEDLKALENKNFKLFEHYTIDGFKEAVKKTANPEKKLWYIAGPPGMVFDLKNILFLNKVLPESVVTEEFSGY